MLDYLGQAQQSRGAGHLAFSDAARNRAALVEGYALDGQQCGRLRADVRIFLTLADGGADRVFTVGGERRQPRNGADDVALSHAPGAQAVAFALGCCVPCGRRFMSCSMPCAVASSGPTALVPTYDLTVSMQS